MNKATKTALATGMGILIASTALAADADYSFDPTTPGGFYGSVFGGLAIPNDADGQQNPAQVAPEEVEIILDLNTGYSISAELGYDFGNGLMLEGQIGYLNVGTGLITLPGPIGACGGACTTDSDGNASVLYGMANAWYGFDVGMVRPFIGGGVGWAQTSIDMSYDFGTLGTVDDSDGSFAWQIGAGAEFDVNESISVVGRYRYFSVDDVDVTDSFGTDQSFGLSTHIVDVGLKFNF